MAKSRKKRQPKELPTPDFRMRRRVLLGALGCAMLAVMGSAVHRQILSKEELQHKGQALYLRAKGIPVRRGEIRDRNGEPLAMSAPVYSVKADPRHLRADGEVVAQLAKILGKSRRELKARLSSYSRSGDPYLAHGLSLEQADAVKALARKHRINTLYTEERSRRYYPSGEVNAHIIGLTRFNKGVTEGIEGLELAYNNWLTGVPGERRVIVDARQQVMEEVEGIRDPKHGESLTLSIDRRLQFLAYKELKRAVLQYRAKGGSAVILDPATGEILAMVNQPSYNPHDRSSFRKDKTRLRNRSVFNVFEPGSTMKPFVVAAVLDKDMVQPNTAVDTAPGYIYAGRNKVSDHRNNGVMDVTSVLTKSSNVGIAKLSWMLQPEDMWSFYQALGIGEQTDTGMPGERSGVLHDPASWSPFVQATNAFGYGMSVTTLQLARAYAAVAADGVIRPVSILRVDEAPEGKRIMRAETARELRRMLETVVSDDGTAPKAAVEGYRVAGKTGTAKVAIRGGYAKKRYHALFAGLLPASDPRLVMVVVIDEPKGKKYYGGLVAAPVFANVMSGAMRLLNVAPDNVPATDTRMAAAEGAR